MSDFENFERDWHRLGVVYKYLLDGGKVKLDGNTLALSEDITQIGYVAIRNEKEEVLIGCHELTLKMLSDISNNLSDVEFFSIVSSSVLKGGN
jgi:hypothetical protein